MLSRVLKSLSPGYRNLLRLRLYQLQTPLLLLINPQLTEVTEEKVEIRIPLSFISKNSWKSMFFAAIAAGADLTGGWAAFDIAEQFPVGVLYKNMSIDFLRRVDGDLSLVCLDRFVRHPFFLFSFFCPSFSLLIRLIFIIYVIIVLPFEMGLWKLSNQEKEYQSLFR